MNKQQERLYLEDFLKITNIKYQEIINSESPDLVLVLSKKEKMGVEVTEYHSNAKSSNGQPRRAIEETRDKLLRSLTKEVKNNQILRCITGRLSFKELNVPFLDKHKQFINEILEISTHICIDQNKEIVIDKFERSPLLLQYLKKLILKNDGYGWHWIIEDFEWVGISEKELLEAINKKINMKYGDEGLSEIWLLISSGTNLSQVIPKHNLIMKLNSFSNCNKKLGESSYDRSFLHIKGEQVFEYKKCSSVWEEYN